VVATLCFRGDAPWLNALLGHHAWVPLARLSYGAYLIHPIVLNFMVLTRATKVGQAYSPSRTIFFRWLKGRFVARLSIVLAFDPALVFNGSKPLFFLVFPSSSPFHFRSA
jgi:peptidoglycan/LPS O-acetylase OafA/YrhL